MVRGQASEVGGALSDQTDDRMRGEVQESACGAVESQTERGGRRFRGSGERDGRQARAGEQMHLVRRNERERKLDMRATLTLAGAHAALVEDTT